MEEFNRNNYQLIENKTTTIYKQALVLIKLVMQAINQMDQEKLSFNIVHLNKVLFILEIIHNNILQILASQ
jgi:hypothetical protein